MAMKRLLSLAAAASVASSAADAAAASSRLSAPSAMRSLQDGADYAYLDDLSGHSLQYSSCVRAKIPQDNDDDEVDGNVNFYNGRYHAQYQIFATFHVCGDGSYGNQCSADCDYGVEYTADAAEYLQTTLNHFDNYCDACANACRRRLEEEEGGNQAAQVDCTTCSNSCATYAKGQNNGNDESVYVDCQAGAVDNDGLQLYYGPECSEGALVIGVFYDEECSIKTKHDPPSFDYYKFDTVMEGCVDCSSEAGQESCGDLYGEAFHCVNGYDKQGKDDDVKACAAVKKAMTTTDYSGVKKRRSGADAFLRVFFTLLLVGAVGSCAFLSYTYYVRHRGEKANPILSSEDVHEEEEGEHPGADAAAQQSGSPHWTTLS